MESHCYPAFSSPHFSLWISFTANQGYLRKLLENELERSGHWSPWVGCSQYTGSTDFCRPLGHESQDGPCWHSNVNRSSLVGYLGGFRFITILAPYLYAGSTLFSWGSIAERTGWDGGYILFSACWLLVDRLFQIALLLVVILAMPVSSETHSFFSFPPLPIS